MKKSNRKLLSQLIAVSYFAFCLAMCTLCVDLSVHPFAKLAEAPAEPPCETITIDPLTEEGNAIYTHLLQ